MQLLRSPWRLLATSALALALGSGAHAEGPIDGSFTAGGLTGDYRVYRPDDLTSDDPAGLILFFHADEASHQTGADELEAFALARNLVVVGLQSPGPTGARTDEDVCWWTPRAEQNAAFVEQLIDDVLVADMGDALDLDRVFLSGLSGGADFASEFNTQVGFVFPGAAVAVCGGDLPRSDGGSCVLQTEPPVLDPLPGAGDLPPGATDDILYYFDTTPNDPFGPLAEDARDYYEGLGFDVSFTVSPGDGHCGFDEDPFDVLRDDLDDAVIAVPEPRHPLVPALSALVVLARWRRSRRSPSG